MNPTSSPAPVPPPPPSHGIPPARSSRRVAAAVVTAGLLGGAAIGLVATMPGLTSAAAPAVTSTTVTSTTVTPTTTDSTAGEKTDSSSSADKADRLAERSAKIRETLQALVDDGTITPDQADAVAAHLAENEPAGGRGGDHGGRGGKGGPLMGADADAFAKVLGLADADALRDELQSGKTLAQIAEANGVEIQTVKNYLLQQMKDRIDAAVASGKLTQAEADAKIAKADEMIDDMINSNRPPRSPKGGRGADRTPNDDGTSSEGPNIVESGA